MAMGEVSWRRIFAISSLIVSFLLVAGSIYLHVQHKHHLGRLNRRQHVDEYNGMADKDYTASSEFTEFHQSSHSSESIEHTDHAVRLQSSEFLVYSDYTEETATTTVAIPTTLNAACMQCICETITQCSPAACFPYDSCGVFRISLPYWIDADKPLASGQPTTSDENITPNYKAGYQECVNDRNCSERAVTAYVNKYMRDCNYDGKIDCRDYIAVHVQGPDGCLMNELQSVFENRMENCLAKLT